MFCLFNQWHTKRRVVGEICLYFELFRETNKGFLRVMTEQYIFVDPQLKVEIIGDVEAAKAAIDDKPGRVAVRNTSQKIFRVGFRINIYV